MFTVLFAIGRTVGWIAHWKEMMEVPESKIGRPRQLYVGNEQREFTSIANRAHTDRRISWSWLWGGKKGNS
jgi:citrate synthase